MEQAPQRPRDPQRTRRIELGVLWIVALLGAAVIAGDVFIADTVEALVRQLRETVWTLPLAAAVVISVLTSQPVRHRWPRLAERIWLGLVLAAGLWGLVAALGPGGALLAGGLVVVGLLAAWVLVLPRRLAPPLPAATLEPLEAPDRLALTDARLKLQNDVRATALQAIGGLAVLAGAVLAFQQLTADRQQATATQELTRQGQASERFTRAIDQLTSDRPEVRLGGIYGLEQIAQQAPDNRLAVTEVLVAYLQRSTTRRPATTTAQDANATTQPVDPLRVRAPELQAALTVLVRRRPLVTDSPLDLRNLDLRGAEVSGQLVLVNNRFGLKEGDLRSADLRGIDLRGASFFGLYLRGTDFRGADLRGVDFQRVNPPGNDASNDAYLGQLPPLNPSDSGIKDADFRGALVDGSTKWPVGFDWQAEGVTVH